jgi:hypothetical protein
MSNPFGVYKVMATITITIPDIVPVGRGGIHGTLNVDWSKAPQFMLDHIGAVHFPQWFSDSFNSGGKVATSAERLAAAQKKLAQLYAGELRTRGPSTEPVDPIEREAHNEARKALAKMLANEGYWKDVPKGTSNRFEYVLNKAQKALGEEETSDVEYITWFLDETEVGKAIRADAVATVARRDSMAKGISGLLKKADAKPVATNVAKIESGKRKRS